MAPKPRAPSKRSVAAAVAAAAAAQPDDTAEAVLLIASGKPYDHPPCKDGLPVAEQQRQHRMNVRRFLVERSGLTELQAHDAEVGVFNWSLERADERRVPRSWCNARFQSLYCAKARSVAANLDRSGYVKNERLAERLAEGEFLPHEVASMQPENVFPERWRDVVEMQFRRDEYISNARQTAMTDQFKCGRCNKRECSYMELQMRSCDEPASLFIQCICCGHNWRVG